MSRTQTQQAADRILGVIAFRRHHFHKPTAQDREIAAGVLRELGSWKGNFVGLQQVTGGFDAMAQVIEDEK